ncbi:UNVERIFIED_CONTAM: hypothetical protein K2H54_052708 [Gekko kuhli]
MLAVCNLNEVSGTSFRVYKNRAETEMKVHVHTQFCLICLLTFVFHQCNHCHEDGHEHHHDDHQISESTYLQNGRTEPTPNKEAEDAQKYYIEKLFDRYSDNGKLSFWGLEKLLTSLGLGEVKVVEINHEDVGHDYVSHLDAIEVQEGRHSHSHNHPNSHSHSGSENQTVSDRPARRSQKCDPEKEVTEPSLKPNGKHAHDHNLRHHGHHHHHPHRHLDHNGSHHLHNDSVRASGHGEPSHEPSTETNTTQEHAEKKPCKPRKPTNKKKSGNALIDTTQAIAPDRDSNEQSEHNRVHKHGNAHHASASHPQPQDCATDHAAAHGHQDPSPASGDGHHHARKREAPHKQISVKKQDIFSAQSHKDHQEDDHHHEECLNITQLLRHYGLRPNSPITPWLFTYLCPALLYQIDRRLCIKHDDDLLIEELSKGKNASLEHMDKTGASALLLQFCISE